MNTQRAVETKLMTPEDYRLFVAAGCVPECHTCGKSIQEGEEFGLVVAARYQDSKVEVMTCFDCRYRDLNPIDIHTARMKIDPEYSAEKLREEERRSEKKRRRNEKIQEAEQQERWGSGGAYVVDGKVVPSGDGRT